MEKYTAEAELTGVALSYKNKSYIADKIFKSVPVSTSSFKYLIYDKSLNLQLPETAIGSTGKPNEVDFGGEKRTESVKDNSLTVYIPKDAVEEAEKDGEDIFTRKTEFLTNIFDACREKRVADLLQNEKNYGSNVKMLGKDEKFTSKDVNAFDIVDTAAAEVWFKPNIMIGSRKAINALRKNPAVVKAANHNDGDSGKASIQDLKEMFELDDVLVGESLVNTSKKGQVANYVGAWGNAIILVYINRTADTSGGITFGFTAEKGKREVYKHFDEERGIKGVYGVKIAEQKTDIIVAPDCGYLIKNVY